MKQKLMTPKRASELIAGRLIDLENRITALEERRLRS